MDKYSEEKDIVVELMNFIKLLNQYKTFTLYLDMHHYKMSIYFTWFEKRNKYHIIIEDKEYEKESIEEILKIPVSNSTIENILSSSFILEEEKREAIEKEIIKNYIKNKYQDRCQYLLSSKKKRSSFPGFFHENISVFREDRMKSVIRKDRDVIKQIQKELGSKKWRDQKGYLLVGYLFDCHNYIGAIGELAEYLFNYRNNDFGILYCSRNTSVLQLDVETDQQRIYWLKI